jgi:hypothetical protein
MVVVVVAVMTVVFEVVMMVKGKIGVAQALNRLRKGTAMIVRRLLVENRRGRHHCLAMKRARIREENKDWGKMQYRRQNGDDEGGCKGRGKGPVFVANRGTSKRREETSAGEMGFGDVVNRSVRGFAMYSLAISANRG